MTDKVDQCSRDREDLRHLRHAIRLAPSPVEVLGPLIEEEAKAPFEAFVARGAKAW